MIAPELFQEHYLRALGDVCGAYPAFRPPRRVSVAQGAADALIIKRPGDSTVPWSATETPYMVEPMNMLASRAHNAVCFVGPAQSGKTAALGEGWMAHVVTNDPGDMLMVQMTEAKAREYSKQRIDRALTHSDKLKALLGTSSRDDNTHDKAFRHGMWLRIAWPTVTNLSSTSYRYVFLTDYDRMPDDIDGEGDAFGMAVARIRTFLSRGMVAVESSPGRDIIDPSWVPATMHEAPPVGGVLGIYNRSDRRRWYWKCLDCAERFEASPGLKLFNLPSDDELLEVVRDSDLQALARHHNKVVCPHCGSMIAFKYRDTMNQSGVWLIDGQQMTADGEIYGDPLTSSIAGYWLSGVAAAYQPWDGLVLKYLQGLRDYSLTGEELSLKTTVNTDQGMPYMSMHLREAGRNAMGPADRTERELQRYVVPDETRCVIASVDVQGGTNARFDVQVHAIGPHREQWLINRFAIHTSKREGMGAEFAPIDPAGYPEDWDRITEEVVRNTYRTTDETREIRVRMTVVDSGGEDGVTANAYAWQRRMRIAGYSQRVMLYKGASSKTAPLLRETLVGARSGQEKGDVPLYVCNPNLLADMVHVGLKRNSPGAGYYHFPEPKDPKKNPTGWLPKSFFDELSAEVRDPNGTWRQVKKRNETFDHCKMILAGCLRLGIDKIKDWGKVPDWLERLEYNSEVVTVEQRRAMKARVEEVAAKPAVVVLKKERRVLHSTYL